VEVAAGIVDRESGGSVSGEIGEGDGAFELGFVLVAIDEFVDVSYGHADLELAGGLHRRAWRYR